MGEWWQINPTKLGKLLLTVIITLVTLLALQTVVGAIDVTSLPESVQTAVLMLQAFFASGTGIFVVGVARHIVGYIRNYWATEYSETYDLNRLIATYAYYQGFVGVAVSIAQLLPEEWRTPVVAVVGVVSLVVDYVFSELKEL